MVKASVFERIKLKSWLTCLISILIATLVISAFIFTGNKNVNFGNEQTVTETANNHFSVVWRGFLPDYDASYPDYYICINDLAANTIPLDIRLYIQNQEASGYYFKISAHTNPPSGWSVPEYFVGYIGVDQTKTFVYSIERNKPSSITQGRITENINIRVSAYYDQGYINLYSYDNFTVTVHLIDRRSSAWTILYYDNFDDGTTQGWGGSVTTRYYRSFRYSLYVAGSTSKSYYIGAGYSEAYAILAIRLDSTYDHYPAIYIDDELRFKPDVNPSTNKWYQFVIPLHLGNNKIRISVDSYGYIDDVYIVAK